MKTPRLAQFARFAQSWFANTWLAQAALIVLPVAILSGVALHFLHEDKAAIEKEAKDRATALAPQLARQLGDQTTAFLAESRKKGLLIEGEWIDGVGHSVPDYPRMPQPADWPARLPPRERELWRTAQEARFQHPNADAANKALTALTESGVATPARANAQLGLLVAAEPHSDAPALIRQAVAIAKQYPAEVTESGTPVADLALLLALRHAPKGNLPPDLLATIETNLSLHPSFLSTDILDAADGTSVGARLRDDWRKQEASRESTRLLMRNLNQWLPYQAWWDPAPMALVHFPGKSDQVLALYTRGNSAWRVTLAEAKALRLAVHADLPDYLGAAINFQSGRWYFGARPHSRLKSLASANGTFLLDSKHPFSLTIDLRNPDLLYAPYRRRLALTQWLIFFAVFAALLGLWRLWQTYRDQTRLNEMKSNLVSSVSHELRAPIAAVRLMAESLESGRVEGSEKQRDYYRLIVRECRRLSSLVENVLDFSRIDQGRKQYHFEPLNPDALLRHTVALLEPGAAERQVRLTLIDPPPDFETLQPSWDSEAVEQSLVNLLDNAIKHSPANAEVRVTVELLPAAVRFWIADDGLGIPAEQQKKIFDLFYRYGSELRRETEGVGIGLSIVKHVAEAHGGSVIVQSAPGQGSRFGLELPK